MHEIMQQNSPARSKPSGPLHHLICDRSGATALEFALVAAPFLALIIAVFQTVLVFLAGRVLDEVVGQSARYIMTGQAQTSNMTQAGFATYVCQNTNSYYGSLFNCNNFMINVQNYGSFAAASTANLVSSFNSQGQALGANGNVLTWTWSPGGPGDIVVVEVMYQWPLVLGPLGLNLSNLANGNRLLMSSAAFKNEPY